MKTQLLSINVPTKLALNPAFWDFLEQLEVQLNKHIQDSDHPVHAITILPPGPAEENAQ